ncbi:MAG: hypothetical protein IIV77_01360 [Bacteroidaceae bacterium]|nr:hypothetical protein [Bacteroidaceae bacterium]
MKNKITKLFMLLVAAASMGAFVSCKDTNEDLYNELRTELLNEINENTTLANALDQRISQLENKLQSLEAWKAEMEQWKESINSCTCPGDVGDLINTLNIQVQEINAYLKILGDPKALDFYTKAEIDATIGTLTGIINGINATIETLKGDIGSLQSFQANTENALKTITQTIEELKKQLEEAKCECDPAKFEDVLERLALLESKMTQAEADIKVALENAATALETAKNAESIANAATLSAQEAISIATNASIKAEQAATDAADAKTIAQNAWDVANSALTTANNANTLAAQALSLAQGNAEEIQKLWDKLNENTKQLQEQINSNKTAIENLDKQVKENTDQIATNTTNIKANADAIQKIKDELTQIKKDISTASADAKKALEDAAAAAAKADANKELIDDLTERVAKNEDNIKTLQDNVTALQGTVAGLVDQVGENTKKIKELDEALTKTNENVSDLSNKYTELANEVGNLKEELAKCQETCKQNLDLAMAQIRVEIQELKTELMKEIAKNSQDIEDLQKQHEADVEWIKEELKKLSQKIDDIDLTEIYSRLEKLEETDKAFNDRITANELTIGELKNDVATLKTDVSDLQKRIDEAEKTLADLTSKIEKLTASVEAIQEYLSKQVTSILIQGTHNPLFGSLSIPGTDIMSTSLIAFYGLPVSDVEFPTSDDANYVRKSEALTDKDMEMLGGLEVFEAPANLPLLNEGGNAGKVYVTINPSSADLTGLKLSIVNTLDEESPIKLSPIKKCEEKLQSGWTRANNGFYVAEASVTPKTVMTENGGLNINKENFSELFKETKEQFGDLAKDFDAGKLNLSELATDVYSVIRELKVDKSGLKCTYTTTDADGTEKEHSVYSQYNLAATFLNPLNLKWGKDFNYVTMPGYELADSLLNRFSNTLKDQVDVILNDVINIDGMQDFIGHFQIDELTYLGEASELISRFEARVSHIVLNGIGYQLEVPGAGAFDVKFNKNLTANGAAVSIPAKVAYNEDNVILDNAAVVIGGDIVNGMTATLVVPARGVEDEVVAAYASILLAEESVSVTVSGNQITMTTTDGEYTLANVNGTSINTNDCTDRLILRDVAGNGGSLRLPIAVEISNDLRDLIERQGGTINDIVTQLNDMLKNINDYQGTINGWIDNGVDNFLKKYLDLINKNVVDFFNSINRRFGPFMVASNNNKGFKYLSSSKSYPTVLSADGLAIYPTTKNMELIVPLARKHVAVTNVFKGNESAQNGNADCKARLQAINGTEKLNTVIDGTVRKIDVSNMESGYTYEIAYSVLDFEGNISTQKYYVTIK